MPLLITPEIQVTSRPDRMIMFIPGLNPNRARTIANMAVGEARKKMPKSSGQGASRLQPLYGKAYFGIRWADSYVWFQEQGIRPFTMRNLAGKTIPMWIDDPTGTERAKNPKAKVRTTASGKTQVLIFRRVAMIGQRITRSKKNAQTGQPQVVEDRPASYPGAPGRIAVREAGSPMTTPGRVAGRIAKGNVGVRWRHPGLDGRKFLNNGITLACQWNGILPVRIYVADETWRQFVHGALYETKVA
jgi:hypothetical protein